MQGVADIFGIDWKKDEARNTARRKEALKQINAQLDRRLAKAEATEKSTPAPPQSGAAPPRAPAPPPPALTPSSSPPIPTSEVARAEIHLPMRTSYVRYSPKNQQHIIKTHQQARHTQTKQN